MPSSLGPRRTVRGDATIAELHSNCAHRLKCHCPTARRCVPCHQGIAITANVEEQVMVPSKPVIDHARVTTNPALFKKTADLHISASNKWAANMFANEGIVYVGDLVRMTEPELLRIPNMRKKLVHLIKHELASMGLRLGMDVPGWTPENGEDPSPEPRGNHP